MKNLVPTFIFVILAIASYGQITYNTPVYTAPTYTAPTYTAPSYGTTNTTTTQVKGYYKANGTYVAPYTRTKSNNTNHDNYSTTGNSNLYTNKRGTRAKDYSTRANNYGSGKTIHTGSRGGQYYYNSKGNKTYVPKTKKASSWPY